MDREIVKTDKRYRRNLFAAYLIGIAVIILFWRWGFPLSAGYISHLPNKEQVEVLETAAHVILLLFIPAAAYLIFIGRNVCRYRAIPYPGMRVIHDTVIIRGKAALFRGWSMVLLGSVMIVLVIVSITTTHIIVLKFKHHPLIRPVFYGTNT